MTNINTAIRYVPDAQPNDKLVELTETFGSQDNAAFLAEVARQLKGLASDRTTAGLFDATGIGCICLTGEYGPVAYGIRRAQELIRTDRTSSYWSHACLVASALSANAQANRDPSRAPWIWESSLDPTASFTNFARRYGASARRLADYARPAFNYYRPHSVPNIAVIAIGLTDAERKDVMDRANHPDVDQLHYDLPALLGSWFGYLSNRAERRNPLSEGQAEYSAAYVQLGYEAAGIDLAPGAHQRNIAPEHIWQTAKFLHQRLAPVATTTGPSTEAAPAGSAASVSRREPVARPVVGWFCVREKAGVLVPPDFTWPRSLRDGVTAGMAPTRRRPERRVSTPRSRQRRSRRRG
jgi:hypothetical protein